MNAESGARRGTVWGNFVGALVEVDVEDPVGRALVDQFDWPSRSDDGPADLTVRFRPGFVNPPDEGIRTYHRVWLGDDVFVDARDGLSGLSGALSRRVGQHGYQARLRGDPFSEPLEVEVYYDEKLTARNDRVLRGVRRAVGTDFAPSTEAFARRVLGELLEPLLHLRLLGVDGGLLHASGVSRDGAAVLFAGTGGVGKSEVGEELVRSHGYDFVSDDLSVVSARGTVQPYLIRLPVSPATARDGGRTASELLAGRGVADRLHWLVRSRIAGPRGARRWVTPATRFGPTSRSDDAAELPIRTVVNLVETEGDAIRIESTTPADVAERATSTIAYEFHPLLVRMLEAHAAAPERWPSLQTVQERSTGVYARALDSVETVRVSVPRGTPPAELTAAVLERVLSTADGYTTVEVN